MKVAHDCSEATRCSRRSWRTNSVEERSGANGILATNLGFYLFTPRVLCCASNSARVSSSLLSNDICTSFAGHQSLAD